MQRSQKNSISEQHGYDSADDLIPIPLTQLCEELKISKSTAKNWLRLRKIEAQEMKGTKAFFSRAYVDELKADLKHGRKDMLKSRRNKKFLSGKFFYKSYVDAKSKNADVIEKLLLLLSEEEVDVDFDIMTYLICECLISLICSKNEILIPKGTSFLQAFLEGEIEIGDALYYIVEFIQKPDFMLEWIRIHPELFAFSYRYDEEEDTIGLLYISIRDMYTRKAQGVYYTSASIVGKMVENIFAHHSRMMNADDKILDPCCGTGNFLMRLSRQMDIEQIFGLDIDELSVAIARMNLGLRYGFSLYPQIFSHIIKQDFLKWNTSEKFDFIIGNPPWGYHFSSENLSELSGKYQILQNRNGKVAVESFSLFIEKSIGLLQGEGVLSFVLPEAILNVGAHLSVRKYLFEHTHLQYVEYIGECFHHVQCPSIILQLEKRVREDVGFYYHADVKMPHRTFSIAKERDFEELCNEFHLRPHIDDLEYDILHRLYRGGERTFIGRDSIFALGIVTGDNERYLFDEYEPGREVILRGRNISKYFVIEDFSYIDVQGNAECRKFQQMAKMKYYRSTPKLLYPFISSKLKFAYDEEGRISLNSCNILIPNVEGLDMKYLLGVLNSQMAQFIYSRMFRSVKILKSHLCQIPIPKVNESLQDEIIGYVNEILGLNMERDEMRYRGLYEELDEKIAYLYGLSAEEYEYIRRFADR